MFKCIFMQHEQVFTENAWWNLSIHGGGGNVTAAPQLFQSTLASLSPLLRQNRFLLAEKKHLANGF